ncbi:MAG TPA: LEA type 2 family protein [Rariglobus sp.]|jgi:LEA14-like dessication related protein
MRFLLSFACLCLCLVVAGCGTPPERRLESPALQVTGLTVSGDTCTLTLRLLNPNTAPLVVSRSTHTVHLGDTRLGRIDDREPIGLPPTGAVTHAVKLPAALTREARAYFSKHPGDVRVSVETSLQLLIGNDDDLTLKTAGSGVVKAP